MTWASMGELLSAEEIERRYPKGDVGIYCLGLSKSLFIDSALIRGACASANASRKGLKPNVRFVPNFVGRSARLEVTRPIPKGGEIFVGYGAEYWRGISSMSYSTVDIPDWEWDTSNPFAPASSTISPALIPSPIPCYHHTCIYLGPCPCYTSGCPLYCPCHCSGYRNHSSKRPGCPAYPGHSPASHLLRGSRRPPGSAMAGVCAWHVRLSIPPGGVRRGGFDRVFFLSSCVLCSPSLLPLRPRCCPPLLRHHQGRDDGGRSGIGVGSQSE